MIIAVDAGLADPSVRSILKQRTRERTRRALTRDTITPWMITPHPGCHRSSAAPPSTPPAE
ncbi:hypothetical protein AB0K15_46450 [Amycolatopsis sp. NPDC049253]|uniref:hypothetical protein n=1 Tax=Amycolatopsis sp. NPDC049253 TaxID=3155274 RepID=UPI003436848A